MEQNTENLTRSGFVALIGAPNAGKSTITNNFVGSKVSIVSPKVQTTRTMVRGIGVYDNTQIIFIDTPGIFKPKRRLDRAMVSSAWSGVKDADIVVFWEENEKYERINNRATLYLCKEGSCRPPVNL